MNTVTVLPTHLTPRVKQILERAEELAATRGSQYIGIEHLLEVVYDSLQAYPPTFRLGWELMAHDVVPQR